ncbi:MAG: plastocyanin/azurin family copper-binding protein [Dehalococcoidia bacterium]
MLNKLSIGALAFAAIAAAGIATSAAEAGGGCHAQTLTEEDGTTVLMEGACFNPAITHVSAGQNVTFINQDEMLHTVTGANTSWGDYEEVAFGGSVSHRFDNAGVYPYFCLLHPGMIGAVVVDGAGAETVLRADGAVVSRADGTANASSASGAEESGIATTAVIAGAAIGAGALAMTGGFLIGRRRPR